MKYYFVAKNIGIHKNVWPILEIEFPILGFITILTVLSFELCELGFVNWWTGLWLYLWEWNTNLFGEKKTVQNIHLIHLALNIRTPSRLNLSLAAVWSKSR